MESPERRLSDTPRTVVNKEKTCRVTQNRRVRGNVRVADVAVNGSYVMIENNVSEAKSKPQQLSGWTLKWTVRDESDINYSFGDYVLQPGVKLKIYTHGYKAPPGDNINCEYIVNNDISSWGRGSGTAVLLDENMAPQQLSGWTLKWTVSNESEVNYSFRDYVLKPGVKLKIYTHGYKAPPGDNINCEYIVNNDISSWGRGSGTAVLLDENMAEKASLTKTVTYHT